MKWRQYKETSNLLILPITAEGNWVKYYAYNEELFKIVISIQGSNCQGNTFPGIPYCP